MDVVEVGAVVVGEWTMLSISEDAIMKWKSVPVKLAIVGYKRYVA